MPKKLHNVIVFIGSPPHECGNSMIQGLLFIENYPQLSLEDVFKSPVKFRG